MSLIEIAVEKAKKIADTGVHRAIAPPADAPATAPPPPRRQSRPQLDEAAAAALAAQARKLPVARVDAATMERNAVLPQVTDTAAHRAYRILRTRVQQRMEQQGWHSLAVTACGSGEGKSLTAINLAIALARDPAIWVYLVDLDLQRPAVASHLGLQFEKGLSDYIGGQARFEEIIYSPGIDRLGVIPNRQVMEDSSDVLAGPRMRELCQLLAAEKPRPIVIFDLPPILLSDDVIKFSPNFDCALFVVSEGLTSRAGLQRASDSLQGINLLGTVLNRSSERDESSYY
jgi:protein-tyrosine kinase